MESHSLNIWGPDCMLHYILDSNSVSSQLAPSLSHVCRADCISNPHEELFVLCFKVTWLMTIISHLSFNIAWLSSKFVYDAFIDRNPIKSVHTLHDGDQLHLETIMVPTPPIHTFFLVNFISKLKVSYRSINGRCCEREVHIALSGLKKISCIHQHTLQLNTSLNSWTGKEHAASINITNTPPVISGNQRKVLGWGKCDYWVPRSCESSHECASVNFEYWHSP